MNRPPRSSLKSLPAHPTGPGPAEPAQASRGGGAAKNAAEGVPSGPDPQAGHGRRPIAWLIITAPRGATPTATSTCDCGRDLFAAGHRRVLALIDDHARHRDLCPLRATEERNVS
ncbi:hypothetical protein ACF08W_22485 [Streptomyces sp. NPDC015144]|uniref:hypothetical protein n=1 Tax=Streptomyces sp. NPDC015144 TaxID=3364944 RepID=UPI003702BE71